MCENNLVLFAEQESEIIHTVEPLTSTLLASVCVCAFLSVRELPISPHTEAEGELNQWCCTAFKEHQEFRNYIYLLSSWIVR